MDANAINQVLSQVPDGGQLVITRHGADYQYTLSSNIPQPVIVTATKVKAAKANLPLSEGYKKFMVEWKALDDAGKFALAEKEGATFTDSGDKDINRMRATMAVMAKRGISKH